MSKEDMKAKNLSRSKGDDDKLAILTSPNRITFIKPGKSKEFLELLKTSRLEKEKQKIKWKDLSSHISRE